MTPAILHTTDDFIIINKPAGLLVHATSAQTDEPTLVDFLRAQFPEIASVGDDPVTRPGIVHRLDRDVSGVMVIARTQAMFDHLKQQFQQRTVHKEYITLVHGDVKKPEGTIAFSITRKSSGEKMAARPDDQGRDAVTHFVVLDRFQKYSLLRVTIATGRTNQIRVHLNAYGHPIVGDFVYRPKKLKARRGERELGRVFLHCKKLEFIDLAGGKQTFEVPLPVTLDDFLQNR